jgi:hypothetical protein
MQATQHGLGVGTNVVTMGVKLMDAINQSEGQIASRNEDRKRTGSKLLRPSHLSGASLEHLRYPQEYDPVVVPQIQGSKTSQWLI